MRLMFHLGFFVVCQTVLTTSFQLNSRCLAFTTIERTRRKLMLALESDLKFCGHNLS